MLSLLDVKANIVAPLDPDFCPAILAVRAYQKAVLNSEKVPLIIALESSNGHISRWEEDILALGTGHDADTLRYVERLVKFLLWARGGWKIYIGGPPRIGEYIRDCYAERGDRFFDSQLMNRIYNKPLEVVVTTPDNVPGSNESEMPLGGHQKGCRIGFDLGASDYKLAAVKDGELLYSDEIPWNPKDEPDPAYHYNHIQSGLEKAASYLPHVDAIGGSAAGVYVKNKPMVASLFRSVPEEDFEEKVKPIFVRLQEKWNVPFDIINDGEVTALAGALSLNKNGMLGIAMGSSQAAGFLNRAGDITGWLNELAFAPVDFNPQAVADEWSGDAGVGVMYFSQQAVNKLALAAGLTFPSDMELPERLKSVQEKANQGDETAEKIFETIGVYLGYTLPYYAMFYEYDNLLILGRVTSGRGGEIIVDKARDILKEEFPEWAQDVVLHVPDEKSRRVGQAVAAASLPVV
ncbi:MAG: ROK family protein [Kiritimatiellae bacterium]|nr:ROK family protein [Kiritimatiellia bacterium]